MPMFKLSKAEYRQIAAAAKQIEKPAAALTAAVQSYNDAAGHLRELARAIETDWQTAWDQRSERWQQDAAGQFVAEAIAAWGTLVDDLEEIEIDIPDIVIPT